MRHSSTYKIILLLALQLMSVSHLCVAQNRLYDESETLVGRSVFGIASRYVEAKSRPLACINENEQKKETKMSTAYRIINQHDLHYLTFQIVQWVDIFTRRVYRDLLIESLAFCRERKGLEIYAYVIMSNHVHLLARSPEIELSKTVKDFKSFTSKRILEAVGAEAESRRDWMLNLFEFSAKQHKRNEKYQVWTHENHAEIIYSKEFIHQKVNYIHANPVRAGWVEHAEDYLYSSARNYAGLPGLIPVSIVDLSVNTIPLMRSVR